jgi:hypothetical protein
MEPDDLIVPVSLPLGDFKPLLCCLCGGLLRGKPHTYREGSVCSSCHFKMPANILRAAREWEQEREVVK